MAQKKVVLKLQEVRMGKDPYPDLKPLSGASVAFCWKKGQSNLSLMHC